MTAPETFTRHLTRKSFDKIINEARKNMPKQQFIDENLIYIPTDDNFKKYKETEQLDTVGKIKFPWDQ